DVRAFIESQPIHGNSFSELLAMSELADAPQLIAMLDQATEEAHWPQIVALLAVTHDDTVVDALISFVEKRGLGDRPLSRAHHDARSSAIRSLGFQINRTGSDVALSYLIDGLTPGVWRDRRVEGFVPWTDSYTESDLLLSTYALFGLAFSGHPRAGDALRALRDSPRPQQALFRSGLDNTLTQWFEVHSLVAERGVAGMYEYYEAQRQITYERQLEEPKRMREERAVEESR
ncbi:MAG TPA: hypothetical protein VJA26_10705, partial [Gammaproteobacteria bacterium]|nr:hypothetical protein [Gammaproteobacteria bacterium]